MNYQEAVSFLEERERLGIHLGTANIARLLERLGNPHRASACFHVAGTNGKGSTARILSGLLVAAGFRTGLYISPHLLDTRERIQVDNEPIPEKEFADLVSALSAPVLEQSRFIPRSLTYFECLTATAFFCFRRRKVDYAVIETGMGGRLDATNVVTPLVSTITPIGLEHRRFLGRTLAAVAGEKAGIIKAGRPVVSAPQRPAALKVLRERAALEKAPFHLVGREIRCEITGRREGRPVFSLSGGGAVFSGLEISLAGAWQAENTATAMLSLRAAGIELGEGLVRRALGTIDWPGRLMVISREPPVVFDVSHNPPAMKSMLPQLAGLFPGRRTSFVFGVLGDKDFRLMLKYLAPCGERFYFTRPDSPRARDPVELAAFFSRRFPGGAARVIPSPEEAVAAALDELPPGGMVCVCGSFYLAPVIRMFAGKVPVPGYTGLSSTI